MTQAQNIALLILGILMILAGLALTVILAQP